VRGTNGGRRCRRHPRGPPPEDFPAARLQEFFALSGRKRGDAAVLSQWLALDREIREWPRTPANDPYHAGLAELARRVATESGFSVRVAFNEFCGPTLAEAVDRAVQEGFGGVVVVPSMITLGGSHSENEIPEELAKVRAQHPHLRLVYAWPFDPGSLARFFADHLRKAVGGA